ncbi:MAG: hypothetical protein JMM75_02260 [Candidatus Xiphinematobacter sp.]|nr:MAG: hypothetical protein JMM75_02260 [Candidatus Xiphinematobacter sp.]
MQTFLQSACEAALKTGGFLRSHFGKKLRVETREAHDIKLELDKRSQNLIEGVILRDFPDHAIYGEEGVIENTSTAYQWIIDPIDGTSNFFWGIPHFAVSIALRYREQVLVGVIYDPMRDELWAVWIPRERPFCSILVVRRYMTWLTSGTFAPMFLKTCYSAT